MKSAVFFLVVLLTLALNANAADTVCSADTDHNGTVDSWCTSKVDDEDLDGVPTSLDCDDHDYHVVNDGAWYQKSGDTAGHLRKCNSNGSWDVSATDFTATGLDEHTGSGRAFYVDCSTGSDSNNCTWGSPCASFKNFSKYYNPGSQPASYIRLMNSGDVAYIKNCSNLTTTYSTGDSSNATAMLWLQGPSDGTSSNKITVKAYPGHEWWNGKAKLSPSNIFAIRISGVRYVDLRGLELSGGGVRLEDGGHYADHVTLSDMFVHGARGSQNNNVAGVSVLTGINMLVERSDFYDNYDANSFPSTSDNNSDIVVFDGPDSSWRYNRFTHTAAGQANCLKFKHNHNLAQNSPVQNVTGNLFMNCSTSGNPYALGSGMSIDAKNNRFIGTPSGTPQIYLSDLGGQTDYSHAINISNNYFSSKLAFSYQITSNWNPSTGATCSDCNPENTFTFEKNVVEGSGATNFSICPYGSDPFYTRIITGGKLTIRNNCYPASFSAGVFSQSSSGLGCNVPSDTNFSSGQNYNSCASFQSAWTGAGSGDTCASFSTNSDNQVLSGCDVTYGWAQNDGVATPTPTPTSTATNTPTATPTNAPTNTPVPSWDVGFFFRDTQGYCASDPSYGTYARSQDSGTGDVYDTSRVVNGQTVHFGTTGGNPGDSRRNRDSGLCSLGLAGKTQMGNASSINGVPAPARWRVDLPHTGDYDIRLAIGEAAGFQSPTNQKVRIYDNTTLKATITYLGTLTAGHYVDANGVEHNSAAAWAASNSSVRLNFTTTTLFMDYGYGDGVTDGITNVALLRISEASAGPTPTPTATNTPTNTPTATNTPTPTNTPLSPTPTPTNTPTPTSTFTPTPTNTPTPTPTPTVTPLPVSASISILRLKGSKP